MKPTKDKNGSWLVQFRFKDVQGISHKTTKRGFATKREADQWCRDFHAQQRMDISMTFGACVETYMDDMKHRLREHTMVTKRSVIEQKILPYFGKKRLVDIKPMDIRNWENQMMKGNYADTYLRVLFNQINAIFNYAVKYLDLPVNP